MELLLIAAVVALVARGLGRSSRRPDTGARPTGWSTGLRWRVVAPLARREIGLLLRHPSFMVGMLLTPMMLRLATQSTPSWRFASTGIALGLVPLGWMTIIAANLVALRSRRSGTDELFSVLPAPQPVRTAALLASAVGPVLVAGAIAIAWVAWLASHYDMRGRPLWGEVGAGLLIVAGSVAVGVAVGRWLPHAAFGLIAPIVTIVLQARFLDVHTWPWDRTQGDPMRFLGFLVSPTSVSADFLEVRRAGWHLLYLAGLVVLMAGVALAREGVRRPVAVVLVVSVAVAAGAGWVQTRPLSAGQVESMVSPLVDPASHQVCQETSTARLCAYPEFDEDLPDWAARVDATLAALPAHALDEREQLQVVQRPAVATSNSSCEPERFESTLPPEVSARLSNDAVWPDDGHVHPPFEPESFPCSERDTHGYFLSVQIAAWAVGLPPATHGRFTRCAANGEARSAVALWAATTTTKDGAGTLADILVEGSTNDAALDFLGWDDPPVWGVQFSVADAELALAMADLPMDEVRAVLATEWAHWIAPATTAGELAQRLGLTAGPVSKLANRPPCS